MGFSFFGIAIAIGIGIGIGIDIVDRLLFAKPVASVAVTAEHRVHPVDFILSHNSVISFFDPDPDFDFDFDYSDRVLLSIASLTCEVGLISPRSRSRDFSHGDTEITEKYKGEIPQGD